MNNDDSDLIIPMLSDNLLRLAIKLNYKALRKYMKKNGHIPLGHIILHRLVLLDHEAYEVRGLRKV